MATESVSLEEIEDEAFGKLLLDFLKGAGLTKLSVFLDQNPNPKLLDLKIRIKKNLMIAESLSNKLSKLQTYGKAMIETLPATDVQIEDNRKAQIALVTPLYFHRAQAYIFAYKALSLIFKTDFVLDEKTSLYFERLFTGLWGVDERSMNCEEKAVRTLFVEGILNKISVQPIAEVITNAFHVIKYGYLSQNCFTEQYDEYEKAVSEFTKSLDEVNSWIKQNKQIDG
jgi:hypothetical protein